MQSCCPLMGPTMCNICSWCHARSCVPEMPWWRPWHFWCTKPCPDTLFRSDVINIGDNRGDPVTLMKHCCLPIRLATAASYWDQRLDAYGFSLFFFIVYCPFGGGGHECAGATAVVLDERQGSGCCSRALYLPIVYQPTKLEQLAQCQFDEEL